MLRQLLVMLVVGATCASCNAMLGVAREPEQESRYSWAFARNWDGTVISNEFCRTTLADFIYEHPPHIAVHRVGTTSNVFESTGVSSPYQVYAWHSEWECITALSLLREKR